MTSSNGRQLDGIGPATAAHVWTQAVDWPWHFNAETANTHRVDFRTEASADDSSDSFPSRQEGHDSSRTSDTDSSAGSGSQPEHAIFLGPFGLAEQQAGFGASRSRSRVDRQLPDDADFTKDGGGAT